ncbi:short chain enoyl-CoA hydratase /3-hydroxyacyl-CoA dehydrogenase [Panacagrimonas perspica]|uniref:enoyl-CoA hydratase n=1 Tax=Panacagrimonas perspica TaxID=381431 RepID=A0A4R7PB99_9GAMM|nr:fatty acid oxidation complex subunit alpha FadB [Panacagrimonas perspica]TDU30731.1 short chain enoyl-CoA hydratase /3-hydroxyacyl-CoA dehydrogenase [Panacagrimonas perspica]THD01555.1 multifunctional fatty acid oxidation complex subunit alpha [Panacagrimonas perspica]
MYQGKSLKVVVNSEEQIAELIFDREGESINKFDARTVKELSEAGAALAAATGIKGLIVSSAKDVFIVGADITEFGAIFEKSEEEIAAWTWEANKAFIAIEDLPFPSITAINGIALGGGFEMCLSTDYRVMATTAQIGFPEVKLGIIPGFGGTVRCPRLIGADNAIEWIAQGNPQKAEVALKLHAVDAVVAPDKLKAATLSLLKQAIAGQRDWKARRAQKTGPLKLNQMEAMMVFETAKGFIAGQGGKYYPAPLEAVKGIQKGASKSRDEAIKIEGQGFAKMAKTWQADAMVSLFLNDQIVKKKSKGYAKVGKPIKQAAVLGAGIMGGGIAYVSSVKGTPIIMKDINDKQLDLGITEASKLLAKEVERKKLTPGKAGEIIGHIRPTLNYGDFGTVDVVVEAVVENPKIKKAVLAEVEAAVKPGTIIASNTSSISIEDLATAMKHPENFLGMHFFNPVHRMPLVEVIYGPQTSKEAIATIATYASSMGKTPIVVKNCPGFLVNRILFPYFAGWECALNDGADFVKVDKVMEEFGWPMGPAYLEDVVGIDTSHHVGEVLAAGYPDRMARTKRTIIDVMYEQKRFGQKNGIGFYKYETDPKGKPKKLIDQSTYDLIKPLQPNGQVDMPDLEILERLMIPMIIETARCVEEGIVGSVAEADMGLIMGIGFPPFRGGALKYCDRMGMKYVIERCAAYAHHGKLYEPTARMKEMAAKGETYYQK